MAKASSRTKARKINPGDRFGRLAVQHKTALRTKHNCVPCCSLCNRMKSDLSEEEFIAHIRKIAVCQN